MGQLHGHWLMAQVLVWHKKRDFERALAERRSALALAPTDAEIFAELCEVPLFAGQPGEVIETLPGVLAANPDFASLGWPYWTLAFADFQDHRYEAALTEAGRAPELTRLLAAAGLAALGRLEEAEVAVREALAGDPSWSVSRVSQMSPFKSTADLDHYLDNLRKAGLPET